MDQELPTLGQRLADSVAKRIGSWSFLIVQNTIFIVWMVLNCVAWFWNWDPYPFILLNLVLSFQAAETGPVLLISANRADAIRAKVLDTVEEHTRLIQEHTEHMRTHAEETHGMISRMQSDHSKILRHLGLE